MGCAFSSPLSKKKLRYLTVGSGGRNDGDAVSLCRERKHLVKKAVKQRQAFADAHFKYIHSLSAVASAIAVFVARYSSPPSQYFITFDSSNSTATPQSHSLIQGSTATSEEVEVEEEERENGVCDHFYDDVEEECKWDFFNLLDEKKVKEERELKRVIRKEEEHGNGKGNGRELLEALKDLEDHFLRAYDSGIEVSKMLEVDKVPSYPTVQDIKGCFFIPFLNNNVIF